MKDKRFQITTFGKESQFGVEAEKSIQAGMTWEDVLKDLEATPNVHIDMVLASMEFHKVYAFTDSDGHACELAKHGE